MNLAVVLAASGREVLLVDLVPGGRAVHRYLELFPRSSRPCPPELLAALGAPAGGEFWRFEPRAGGWGGGLSTVVVGAPLAPPDIDWDRVDAVTAGALRAGLLAAGFDEVIVVLPESADGEAAERVAALVADSVIAAVAASEPTAPVAESARRIRAGAPVRVDVLPALTGVPAESSPMMARSRAEANSQFGLLFAEQAHRVPGQRCVELPLLGHGDAGILSALAEGPDSVVRGELAQLASWFTGGAELPAPDDALRADYRRSVGLDETRTGTPVVVLDTTAGGRWAEWARTHVVRAGGEVVPLESASPETPVLMLVSERAESDAPRPGLRLVRLTVPGPDAATAYWQAEQLRLRMLTALDFVPPPEQATRFPWSVPPVVGLPVTHFLPGADDPAVTRVRELFRAATSGRTVVVAHGPSGSGKSTVACAYAARFAWDYHGVWWLPAGNHRSLLRAIAALGRALPGVDAAAGQYGSTAALTAVTSSLHRRFLLVYDGCDDPESIAHLVPKDAGTVHVLVTSRTAEVPFAEHRVGIGALTGEQAVAWLTARAPAVRPDVASAVTERLDRDPLAVRLAGAWLKEDTDRRRASGLLSTADAVSESVDVLIAALDGHLGATPAAAMVAVTTATLTAAPQPAQITVALARCLTRLASDGVALEFIRSRELTSALAGYLGPAGDALAIDATEADRALHLGERFGLFTVDWGRSGQVRLNRSIADLVVAQTDPAERAVLAELVLDALAAFAPTETDPPELAPRLRELAWHVDPSGALTCTRPQVRRWLVNQVRFLYEAGIREISEETLARGEALLVSWDRAGVDEGDPLRLRLLVQLANVARSLGRRGQAKRLDIEARDRYAAQPVLSAASLVARRGLAGDERGLGNYRSALTIDWTVRDDYVRELGKDHPQTRKSANNLACSLHLHGDAVRALGLERRNHRRLARLFGPDHVLTDQSEVRIAVYERELGRGDPRTRFTELESRLADTAGREHLALIAQWQLSMVQRDSGELVPADLHATGALAGFRAIHPPGHPDIVAAMLTSASVGRRLGRAPETTVELVQQAIAAFDPRDFDAEHPFRTLADIGLGLATAAAGGHGDGIAIVADAHAALLARFDSAHPWTIAAALDLAVLTAADGRLDEAAERTADALDELGEILPGHPYAVVAETNLDLAKNGVSRGWREIDVDIPHT